jgi:hypothetical protein
MHHAWPRFVYLFSSIYLLGKTDVIIHGLGIDRFIFNKLINEEIINVSAKLYLCLFNQQIKENLTKSGLIIN